LDKLQISCHVSRHNREWWLVYTKVYSRSTAIYNSLLPASSVVEIYQKIRECGISDSSRPLQTVVGHLSFSSRTPMIPAYCVPDNEIFWQYTIKFKPLSIIWCKQLALTLLYYWQFCHPENGLCKQVVDDYCILPPRGLQTVVVHPSFL